MIATVSTSEPDETPTCRSIGLSDTVRTLHRGHALFAALSLLVTLAAMLSVRAAEDARADRYFESEIERTADLLSDRLQRYEDLLWASVAKVTALEGEPTRTEWLALTERLAASDEFPAITGSAVGFAVAPEDLPAFVETQRRVRPEFTIWPEGETTRHLLLTHVRPEAARRRFEGNDASHDPMRETIIRRAARRNAVRITAPMAVDTSGELDVALIAPFYRDGEVPAPDRRVERLAGWIGVTIRIQRLLDGVLAEARRDIRIRLRDGNTLIHDEHDTARELADPDPLRRARVEIPMYGRPWQLDVESTLTFREEFDGSAVWAVLVIGLLIDALLFSLLLMLTRTTLRAERVAGRVTRSLRARERDLAGTNEERQGFAHVVIHGLTMPLSDIRTLAARIHADLDEPLTSATRREIRSNLIRVQHQSDHAAALIDGVLGYHSLQPLAEPPERCELDQVLEQVTRRLDVDRSQLRHEGDVETLHTRRTCLEQALAGLIDNAFAHHPDPAHAHITVSAEDRGRFVRFRVIDDGIGIDPANHDRIFELLHTVHTCAMPSGAGVGLPIVRKIVERSGGTISVRSALGEGSTFIVDWPREQVPSAANDASHDEMKAA